MSRSIAPIRSSPGLHATITTPEALSGFVPSQNQEGIFQTRGEGGIPRRVKLCYTWRHKFTTLKQRQNVPLLG
jgi:hypothetical protein